MQIIACRNSFFLHRKPFYKTLLVMKLTVFLLLAICLQSRAAVYAQGVTLSEKNVSLDKVFKEIKKQVNYTFVYTEDQLRKAKRISINISNGSLQQALDLCMKDQPLEYTILNQMVIIKEKDKQPPIPSPTPPVTITGRITNQKDEPLSGASITEKGTKNNTLTGEDGSFTIAVSRPNAVLVISYVGYKSVETSVGNQTVIRISLEQATASLNDVVVVGYGTQKRKDLTGSVASVGSKDIKDMAVPRVDQALLGKAAGVQVKPVSGQPGAAPQIRVRGIGSISASAEPLYVVDGFPVSDIQTLNPNDVETMDILKDASATAIYGSRGSNGVILITTKRGRTGTPIVSFDTYYGLQEISLKPKMMNSKQEAQYFYDGVKNRNLDAGNDVTGDPSQWKLAVPATVLDVLAGRNKIDIDWLSLIMRKAPQQQHQLTVRGGDKNIKYALSGEFFDQQGIIRNTDFKRYSVRSNIDAQLTKKLAVRLNLNPSYTGEKIVTAAGLTSGPTEDVIGSAMAVTPFYPVYDSAGNYFSYNNLAASGNFYHPLALVNEIKHTRKALRMIGNINLEYKLVDGLTFNVLTGVDMRGVGEEKFKPKLPAFLNDVAYASDSTSFDYNWLTELTLNYNKSFGNHHLTGLLGYTTQRDRYTANYLYSDKLPNNLVPTLSAASGLITTGTSTVSEWSMISYLARVNYNYNSKYYLTASFRTDGSSRFGDQKKYGKFPSAAVAWRVSEEDFLKDVKQVSELKIRASYGVTGNNNIGNYDHLATINYENYALGGAAAPGYGPARIANPLLTWETQEQFNLGVDLSLFDRRLNVTVDNFQSRNTNLLLNVNTPDISGFSTALKNIGEVKNTGWEFIVSTQNIRGEFEWATDFNFSTFKNKVVKLGPSGDPIISGGNITQIGQPIGMFYGWLTNGIFKNQAELNAGPIFAPGTASASHVGDTRFVDVSGPDGKPDGIINSFDKTIMGSPYPDFYYGMTNRFAYKNLSFVISLQGTKGAQILNLTRLGANMSTRARTNQLALSNNYWKSPDQPGDGNTPRPNDAPTGNIRGQNQQKELDNGTYMRVNNMTLAYVLPDRLAKRISLSAIRVYLNANNPFIITKFTSFNPDTSNSGNSLTPGIDLNDYPLPKSLTLGLNVTF